VGVGVGDVTGVRVGTGGDEGVGVGVATGSRVAVSVGQDSGVDGSTVLVLGRVKGLTVAVAAAVTGNGKEVAAGNTQPAARNKEPSPSTRAKNNRMRR